MKPKNVLWEQRHAFVVSNPISYYLFFYIFISVFVWSMYLKCTNFRAVLIFAQQRCAKISTARKLSCAKKAWKNWWNTGLWEAKQDHLYAMNIFWHLPFILICKNRLLWHSLILWIIKKRRSICIVFIFS